MHFLFHKPDFYFRIDHFPPPRILEHTIPAAPEYLRGLRALFVADLHLRRRTNQARIDALVAQIAATQPDMMLFGGDYAEDSEGFDRFLEAFGALSCPLGAYAVPGNNDSELFPDRSILRRKLEKIGIRLLNNECISLVLPGGSLHIAGCDEPKHGHPRTENIYPPRASYRILLSHYPVLPDCDADLMLSGHTHGGQCNFCGITPYALGYEARRHVCAISGLRRFGDMHVLVSNGIGVSKFPFRMGAEPQIHILNFGR